MSEAVDYRQGLGAQNYQFSCPLTVLPGLRRLNTCAEVFEHPGANEVPVQLAALGDRAIRYARTSLEPVEATAVIEDHWWRSHVAIMDDLDAREVPRSNSADTNDSMALYLQDISTHPLLDQAEEVALAQLLEAGQAASESLGSQEFLSQADRSLFVDAVARANRAKQRMINSNLRFVVSIAKRRQGKSVPLIDLVQEGNKGLQRAVETFDWRLGFKFSTFAKWQIDRSIRLEIKNGKGNIRIPVHFQQALNLLDNLERQGYGDDAICSIMTANNGKKVDAEKLALLREVRGTIASGTVSLQERNQTDHSDASDCELGDLIPDTSMFAEVLQNEVESNMLRHDLLVALKEMFTGDDAALKIFYIMYQFGFIDGKARTREAIAFELNRLGFKNKNGAPFTKHAIRDVEKFTMQSMKHPAAFRRLSGVLPEITLQEEWKNLAACANGNPEEFIYISHVGEARRKDNDATLRLLKQCEDCQVQEQCRDYNQTTVKGRGLWGGKVYKVKDFRNTDRDAKSGKTGA